MVYRNKPVVRDDSGNVAKGLDKERPASYVLGPHPVMERQISGLSYVPCEVCLASGPCICFYLLFIQDLGLSSIQLFPTGKTWAIDGKPRAKLKSEDLGTRAELWEVWDVLTALRERN